MRVSSARADPGGAVMDRDEWRTSHAARSGLFARTLASEIPRRGRAPFGPIEYALTLISTRPRIERRFIRVRLQMLGGAEIYTSYSPVGTRV